MNKVFRFGADATGTDSIASYIAEGSITNFACNTFDDFLVCIKKFDELREPDSIVIFDTLTSLLENTRTDILMLKQEEASLEVLSNKFMANAGFGSPIMNSYGAALKPVFFHMKRIIALAKATIILCHENEAKDEQVSFARAVPQMNPAALKEFLPICTDIFRLSRVEENKVDSNGEVVVKAGTRILYLHDSDQYLAKYQVDRRKKDVAAIPRYILDPTMESLIETLGKLPHSLCIYGYPGRGKTTLAASIVEALQNKI